MEPVDFDVYRGPRPQSWEFDAVKATVSSVVSLEGIGEDDREARELAPVRIYSRPINFFEIYATGVPLAEFERIVGCIAAAPKPVLVHCEHGEDRTGLVIAAHCVLCGWAKDAAMAEALRYDYRRWLNFGLNKTWGQFE
jgi:tyrosine-protein phosphatase SIW14